MRKRHLLFCIVCVGAIIALIVLILYRTNSLFPLAVPMTSTSNAPLQAKTITDAPVQLMPAPNGFPVPAKAERLRMTKEDRLQLLEKLGYLPDDSASDDCI